LAAAAAGIVWFTAIVLGGVVRHAVDEFSSIEATSITASMGLADAAKEAGR
jgi:hypothetical protein